MKFGRNHLSWRCDTRDKRGDMDKGADERTLSAEFVENLGKMFYSHCEKTPSILREP